MGEDRKYFNVYFPNETVNTAQRFFFFKTLFEQSGEPSSLGDKAQGIITDGLGNFGKEQESNSDGELIIQQALNFLLQTIQYERNQEIEFFNNHFNDDKIPGRMRQELMDCVSGDNIDYLKFIALINEYYQGLEQFKSSLNYEAKRLRDFNNYFQEFKTKYTMNKKGIAKRYGKPDVKNSDDEIYYMFNQYLLDKVNNFDEQTIQRLMNTQTLASRISMSLRGIYEEVWKNTQWQEILTSQILENKSIDTKGVQEAITVTFLTQFVQRAQNVILNDLASFDNANLNQGLPQQEIEKIANDFVRGLDFSEEDNADNSNYKLIQELIKNLKKNQNLEKDMSLVYKRAFKRLGDIRGTKKDATHTRASLSGMTKDALEFFENWAAQNINYDKGNEINASRRKSNVVKALAEHFNISLVREGDENKKSRYQRKDYTKIAAVLDEIAKRDFVPVIKINAKNPFMSEFITGLLVGQELLDPIVASGFTSPSSKADTTIFEWAKVQIDSKINFDKIAKEITDNHMLTYTEHKALSVKGGKTEEQYRKEKKLKYNEFSIEAETEKRILALEKLNNDLRTELEADGATADEIEAVLKSLRESFAIDTTVKNYDKFDNTKGFSGGSIGGSLETQVDNILKMFSYGGITLPDRNWLLFAIYNCGPGLVGGSTGAKKTIEDLFSTVAVMLLFEDSGQQAQYIVEQAKNQFFEPPRKFLHLYNLNGMFFPQSYILQLTYNGLVNAYASLESTTKSNGSRANIINPVNISNMVGEQVEEKGYKRVVSPQNWYDTFSGSAGAVSIQITFLAGFLDILEELNKMMSEPF